MLVVSEHKGAQVKGRAKGVGDPLFLVLNKLLENVHKDVLVYRRQAHTLCGGVHSFYVLEGSEKAHRVIVGAVSLKSLKYLSAVVKNGGCGVQGDIAERNYSRVVPAATRLIVHNEHMVGEKRSEAELILGRHCFGVFCFYYLDFHFLFPFGRLVIRRLRCGA